MAAAGVERLCRENGHSVNYLPPYHPELQPIEMLWSHVKGDLGMQYSVGRTSKGDFQKTWNSRALFQAVLSCGQ